MCRRRTVLTLAVAVLLSHALPQSPQGNLARAQGPTLDGDGNPLPVGAVARLGGLRFRHRDCILTVAFSPDGNQVVSGGLDDGTLRLWEVQTGKEIRSFRGPTDHFRCAALSPDGKTLIARPFPKQSNGHGLVAWDVATGKEIENLKVPPAYCGADYATYAGPNLVLARVSRPQTFHLWHSATGKEVTFAGLGNDVGWLVFSADGSLLACAADKEVRLWDVATGKEVRRFPGLADLRPDFALAPGGKLLAVVTRESTVRLWDPATGKTVRELRPEEGRVIQVAFSPDGKTLAAGTYEGLLRFWDVATGKEKTTVDGHAGAVCAVSLSTDGKTLATASFDRTVRLWDTQSGKERQRWQAHSIGLSCVALSPDGKRVAAAGGKPDSKDGAGSFHLWDAASGREVRPPWHEKGWGMAVAFSPDGRALVTGSADGTLRLLEGATGNALHSFKKHQDGYDGGVRALAFSPDGRALATAALGDTLSLWEVATGERREVATQIEPAPHPHSARSGRLISQSTIRPIFHHRLAMMESLAFTPDGKKVVTGGGVGFGGSDKAHWTIRFWDTATLEEVRRLVAHPSHVFGVAIAPDGKLLATGHEDGALVLWDVATGHKRAVLTGHGGAILAVAFSADGKRLATGGKDGTAFLWDVARALTVVQPPPTAAQVARELEALWPQLTVEDARWAYRAARKMTATPRETVAFLKERLRPVAAVEARRIAQWIADLDSKQFAQRDKATVELEKVGHLAAPVLRAALTAKSTLEFRRRVEQLLEKLKRWTPERLGRLRGLEVLEQIGTAEARQLLESLAQGAAASPWTQAARASVERLARRAARIP